MDFTKYRALLQVIELGSLSAAAESLGYTPSGISRMMAALETEAGFPLLLRRREGVAPTDACRLLLPDIREFVYHGEKLRQSAAKILNKDIGTLTIGTAYSAYYQWLTKVTARFHRQYPGIQIKILGGCSSELLQQMASHTVDLCFISQRPGNHRWIPLCQDQMVAIVAQNHPLAQMDQIPLSIFAQEPYIQTLPDRDVDNDRVFRRCGIQPNTQFSTMDIHATYAMVEAGLGIAMDNAMNSRQQQVGIATIPLDPLQQVNIGLACDSRPSPVTETFLAFVDPFLEELRREL